MLRYCIAIFLGAFLLFQVQPIIARSILPWFGGTPSVWTTCMLFFQMLLLGGYAWAHLVVARSRNRRQAVLQGGVVLLSLCALGWAGLSWGVPLLPSADWKPETSATPVSSIIITLLVAVGLPYLVLATTSPLLQAWFSRTNPTKSPYPLYTLSNAGSLLALITYPFLVEPLLTLHTQALVWSVAYVLFALACGYCALTLGKIRDSEPEPPAEAPEEEQDAPPGWRRLLFWAGLPALASVMLLAVTNHLCQEVAVVPFLWVLPLSLYLLSFIICFAGEEWYSRKWYLPLLVFALPAALGWLWRNEQVDLRLEITWYSVVLLLCCMVCHGEVVAARPKPRHLTAFYLAISVGGALGGLFVGVIAPQVFDAFTELSVGLIGCLVVALAVAVYYRATWWAWVRVAVPVAGVSIGVALLLLGDPWTIFHGQSGMISRSRNFYGLLRVSENWDWDSENDEWIPESHLYRLVHGRTIHGIQYQEPERRMQPCSYFAPQTGIARATRSHPRRLDGESLRIGVMGLGTGTMAALAKEGDYVRFYEINPDVLKLSGPGGIFTYVSDCPGTVDIAMGDARISLERELEAGSQEFDVLAMDAFSSDAVPAHLLTREAFEVYLQHMRGPDGIIAVNISNKWIDLRPVMVEVASHFGLSSVLIDSEGDDKGAYTASWVLVSPSNTVFDAPELADAAVPLDADKQIRMWSDDFYSLFQVLL